jgi:hypothetical protein
MQTRSHVARVVRVGAAFGIGALAASACGRPAPDAGTPPTEPAIALSPAIPGALTIGSDTSLAGLQGDFDVFSWNSFIALNWPRGADGGGDPTKKPGADGDNATVWQGWQDASDTFLAGGRTPSWGARGPVPAACQALATPGVRVLAQIGKTPGLLEESIQPFDTGPLIDQAGRFARFEIVMNRPMFDYIVANGLYSKSGQQAFPGAANFPCGTDSAEGAIMVKAAWKILAATDDRARFHASDVLVYTPATENPRVPESCAAATVGLVGLHIAHKTARESQWVWSTFEHEDNVPGEADVARGTLKPRYSFYNPDCRTCPVNKAAPRPWNPEKGGPPTQAVRVDALPAFASASAVASNAEARKLLAGVSERSVWQYYELVSTQWPTNSGDCAALPADPFGTPAPQFLANTTLETYVQGTTPNVSSSCIHCHGNAAMTTGRASDFTYLLQRAR